MRTRVLLLDLDDTLLQNPMSSFIPAYFEALGTHLAQWVDPETLITELLRSTRAMEGNLGQGPTNEETFSQHFFPALGLPRRELQPEIDRFYAEVYPRLKVLTEPAPGVRPFMEWAFCQGYQIVIATNPLFPMSALRERLDWAGVPVSDFNYSLVTSFEEMHATKASPAYYEEICQRLEVDADECLMVGDDWERDIVPATRIGISAFWITESDLIFPLRESLAPGSLYGQGSLEDLWKRLRMEAH